MGYLPSSGEKGRIDAALPSSPSLDEVIVCVTAFLFDDWVCLESTQLTMTKTLPQSSRELVIVMYFAAS